MSERSGARPRLGVARGRPSLLCLAAVCEQADKRTWTAAYACILGHKGGMVTAPGCGGGPLRPQKIRCPFAGCGAEAMLQAVCCMSEDELNADVPPRAQPLGH